MFVIDVVPNGGIGGLFAGHARDSLCARHPFPTDDGPARRHPIPPVQATTAFQFGTSQYGVRDLFAGLFETHMRPPSVNRHDQAIPENSSSGRYQHPELQVICLLIQIQVVP